MKPSPPYAPRNALNADTLRRDIEARSAARGDAPEIRAWLENHFFRHLVANFTPAMPIPTLAAAREKLAPAAAPEWVIRHFAAQKQETGVAMVWIAPDAPELFALETRLVEFLSARKGTALEGKLNRVNCPQALALWEKEHALMAARTARGWRQSDPAASKLHLATPRGHWLEFCSDAPGLRAELAFESYVMRHCVGQFADRRQLSGGYGETYASAVEAGATRLFSFRDAGGQPHITVSLARQKNGDWRVDQIKGKQNRPPIERYVDDLLALLETLESDNSVPPDALRIGLVKTAYGWQRAAEITKPDAQLWIVAHYPALFSWFSQPAPAVEWLAAAALDSSIFTSAPPASEHLREALAGVPQDPEAFIRARADFSARHAQDSADERDLAMATWMNSESPEDQPAARPNPFSNRRLMAAGFIGWLSLQLGFPDLLVGLCFVLWFARQVWRLWRDDDADTRFSGARGFALALALPMVKSWRMTGFFERDSMNMEGEGVALMRSTFLHYIECRADASDDEVRRHLARTLEPTWFRADLYRLAPGDNPWAALGFAICRMAFFLRNAALFGWIAPEMAWRLLLLNAHRAREIFSDWHDYAEACQEGRRQWLAAFRADPLGGSFSKADTARWLREKPRIWQEGQWKAEGRKQGGTSAYR